MLSLEKCRAILGPDVDIDDHTLEALRDQMYRIANIALEASIGRDSVETATEPQEEEPI